MQRIAVISDTHIPERAHEIPAEFRKRVGAADHTIHAGDFTAQSVYADLADLTDGNLIAVTGNMDPRHLDLPSVDTLHVEDVTFVVTHGTGNPREYEDRVAGIVREAAGDEAIGVAGHTHTVLDITIDGTRLLNPGSVTGAAPASRTTMMTVSVEGGDVDVTVHEI